MRVLDTLRVGDPVIVRGRLRAREYEKDGQVHSVIEIEATSIGPDLARCSATVSRRTSTSDRPGDGGGAGPDDVDQQGSAAPMERGRDEAAVGV